MTLRLPKVFRENLVRKGVAFFFAVLIWLAVDSQLHDFTMFSDVPVILQYDPTSVALEREYVNVDVTLQGPSKRLRKTEITDIRVTARIPPIPKGVYFYELHLSPDDVSVRPGIRVKDISPKTVLIPVDRIETKHNVPIRVRFAGELQDGYRLARKSVFPSAADIRGPSKIVKDIRELVTEPVLLDETLEHDFEVDVDIVDIPKIRINTETVHVSLEIARHSTEKSFHDLPIFVMRGTESRLNVSTPMENASITLHGPKINLDALDELSIRPFIDISSITSPGRYRRPVRVWINGAPNVTAEYVHPSIVEVTLSASEAPPLPERVNTTE